MYVYIHTQYTVTFSSAAMVYTDSLALSLSLSLSHKHTNVVGPLSLRVSKRYTLTAESPPLKARMLPFRLIHVQLTCMQVLAGMFFHTVCKCQQVCSSIERKSLFFLRTRPLSPYAR